MRDVAVAEGPIGFEPTDHLCCGYGADRVDPASARVLSFVHPTCNHGEHRPSASLHADGDDGWRLTGELDIASLAELELALSAIATGRDVHLRLDDLQFIDISGGRALVSLAQRLAPDHHLVLHEPAHILRRVLELGWPEPPASLVVVP